MPAKTTTTRSKTKGKTQTGVDQRLVKALAHPLRVQILGILNERMASPNELSKELNEGLSQVSYHVKVLKDYECIELVKTEPRRGAVEHYYRATSRAFLGDQDWQLLPDSVKPGVSQSVLQLAFDDVAGALRDETFDAREDRHLSWTPVVLDDAGWQEMVDLFNQTLDRIISIQDASSSRLVKSKGTAISATTVLMNFESLKPSRKTPKKAKAAKKS